MGFLLIGLGAGLVSALLLATIASGSGLAMVLMTLSPLPLLIVGLGWTWRAALVGALIASAALAMVTGAFSLGLGYLAVVGAPAAALSYLALLGRPADESSDPALRAQGGMEWYPLGRLVAWLGLAAGATGALFILQFGFSLESYVAAVRPAVEGAFGALERARATQALPAGNREAQVAVMAALVPLSMAIFTLWVLVLNLWLAGKVVVKSGRSPRPWPDIPSFTLPTWFLYLTLGSLALAFVGPDILGLVAGCFAVATVTLYALQGLAVLHFLTRGVPGRTFILLGVYVGVMVFVFALVVLALVGLLDGALKLRARAAARQAGAGPPSA